MSTNKFQISLVVSAFAMAVAGCSSYSGLDAGNKFACKAPDGVTCLSVSGIYANAKEKNLPGQKRADEGRGDDEKLEVARPPDRVVHRAYGDPINSVALAGATPKTSPKDMSAPNSGPPVRTPERILRVWLAPFEDQEGDLHDQKYFYVTVTNGAWTIEANRVNIRSNFQRVQPLSRNNPANSSSTNPGRRGEIEPSQSQPIPVPAYPPQGSSSDDAQ